MSFLLADSFQTSLDKAQHRREEGRQARRLRTADQPVNPGLQCHRLVNIKDKNFCSARASREIRLIFHRVESSVMLCYVAQHDPAYEWASRRKIETHPGTGAAQLVAIRETLREIQIPLHIHAEAVAPQAKRPLSKRTEADLLSHGIPAELIPRMGKADATMPCWFIDSDDNGESFFVRQAYVLGQNDPYTTIKTSLKAEIDQEAWESLNSDTSVPFAKPSTGRIAVKVINHLGDEVMTVYRV
jgi:hypothetical protein